MNNGFFKTSDGTRIFFSEEGEGPALVFCYGLVCSQLHWSYQMEYFKKSHKIIWIDYRGHHNSATPRKVEGITIANIAGDIEQIMNELKIEKATVLGHSMGVNVALDLYRRAPHKVNALVLANGCARAPLEGAFNSNILQFVIPIVASSYKKSPHLTNYLWRFFGGLPTTKALVGWAGFNPHLAKKKDISTYVDMVGELDLAVTLQIIKDYESYNALPWLNEVRVPTLIVAGDNDHIIPKAAQELMHQLIPNSQFELIRNGSHCPQMDIPELINVILEKFLKGTVNSS